MSQQQAPSKGTATAGMPNSALWHKGFVVIVLVSCLVNFGNHFVGSGFSYWIVDKGGTSATFGLIHGLYSALCMFARPVTGWLADHGNRRTTFLCSCFVYASTLILMLVSPLFGVFVAMRLIQGVGVGSATTIVNACAYDEVPADKMDKGVGYISLFSSIVTAITPALSIKTYNQSGPETLVIWSVISVVVGAGLSFLVVFRRNENSQKLMIKDVFDPKQLFDARCLKPSILLACSVYLGLGVRTFVNLYGRSLGFANPGWFSTISAFGLIFVRLILDRIKAKEEFPRKRVYFAYGVFVLYLLCLAFCRNLAMFYTAAILWSVAFGILMPSFTSMVIRSVPTERRGVAASMTGVTSDVGMILGSTVGGYIADSLGYPALYLLVLIPVVACVVYYRVALDGKFHAWDEGKQSDVDICPAKEPVDTTAQTNQNAEE